VWSAQLSESFMFVAKGTMIESDFAESVTLVKNPRATLSGFMRTKVFFCERQRNRSSRYSLCSTPSFRSIG
jgi:hypothetical protein